MYVRIYIYIYIMKTFCHDEYGRRRGLRSEDRRDLVTYHY